MTCFFFCFCVLKTENYIVKHIFYIEHETEENKQLEVEVATSTIGKFCLLYFLILDKTLIGIELLMIIMIIFIACMVTSLFSVARGAVEHCLFGRVEKAWGVD